MTDLAIPFDPTAEAAVVGVAVATQHGAALAAERLGAEHFYTPRYARLFAAALELVDVEAEADRIARAAVTTDVDDVEVERLVKNRPAQWDGAGVYAQRVRAAAERRRLLFAASEVVDLLRAGGSVTEARARLQAAV